MDLSPPLPSCIIFKSCVCVYSSYTLNCTGVIQRMVVVELKNLVFFLWTTHFSMNIYDDDEKQAFRRQGGKWRRIIKLSTFHSFFSHSNISTTQTHSNSIVHYLNFLCWHFIFEELQNQMWKYSNHNPIYWMECGERHEKKWK